ncbi:MAG TPA: GNAT family N-acetyltransferase [Burkholderiales bacterium]|nr:GNAT family N-acetyltransferase [Burkholderiales bacterium]
MSVVRAYREDDLDAVAAIHSVSFPRQLRSRVWIAASFGAYPKTRMYVAESDARVIGFAMWTEKSGFRAHAVLELEQIAVAPEHRRRGIAEALIRRSLSEVEKDLETLKAVVVTTRADNAAQALYRKTLGAEVEATIASLYSGDEVLMVARLR